MSEWHGGKGSKRRREDTKKFNENWERIFHKPKEPVQITEPRNQKEKQKQMTELNWDGDNS